jgi:hypothetical protein
MKDKKIKWKNQLEICQKYTDKYNYPLDPLILEAVCGLNILGVETIMSCEGHFVRNIFPYITFNHEYREVVYNLLEMFYSTRKINYDLFLFVTETKGLKILKNYATEINLEMNEKEREIYHKKCQDEMTLFGKFLKKHFLSLN